LIVQCDKCLTRFKVSDSKVRGKVVRIRCARCHQPFTVRGEESKEKKEATNKGPDLNEPNSALSTPEGSEPGTPPLGYDRDSTTEFSLGELEASHNEDADSFGDGLKKPDDNNNEIDNSGDDGPTAETLDLSIDAPFGEDRSVGDHPAGDHPATDQPAGDSSSTHGEAGAEQPFEDDGPPQGLSMELSSDSVLVDGEEVETPDSGDFSSDDFNPGPDEDGDTFNSGEFVPEDAPPEDIIEDSEDDDKFDLGIGTGITIDPDLEDEDTKRPFESSIEDTLEESGFGFSLEGASDDTEEDFTRDIDEFPVLQEDEDPEFKTELPDFKAGQGQEFKAGPGNELNDDNLLDKTDNKKWGSDEAVAGEIDGEAGIEDLAPELSPEDSEDSNDDFGLPEAPEAEDEPEDDFALTKDPESSSETGGDFMVDTEPSSGNEEVFKGFADEPTDDETSEAGNSDEAPKPCEDRPPCTGETGTPEEEAPETNAAEPYAREDLPPAEQDEEPIEANYNPQQPLPFETPSSPRPEMTYTPTPQASDPAQFPPGQADGAGGKSTSTRWMPLILIAIVVYGGIAALYSIGLMSPPQNRTAEISPIRIERIRGVFIENREMGRIFTIEGRVRNFSEEPQGISMIRGVLEDGQGRVIAARKVTPGKIISKEALKTISRNELRKKLGGVPGGSIPPKGSIPVMVIFTKLPKGFAGAGVEVYRR